MKRWTFSIVIPAVLCLAAPPALADLFGFSASNLDTTFDSVTAAFTATHSAATSASVWRNLAPTGTATFLPYSWNGSEAFATSMTISEITATSAVGVGSFSFSDVSGNLLTGDVSGTWAKVLDSYGAEYGAFVGVLTNVIHAGDGTFDGHLGTSASMEFSDPGPWHGTLMASIGSDVWFTDCFFDAQGGSVTATVVPVPAAALLGLLGLGAAGMKLRKFA